MKACPVSVRHYAKVLSFLECPVERTIYDYQEVNVIVNIPEEEELDEIY